MLVLTFEVGADRVGLDVRRVVGVVPLVRLAPLAGGPPTIAGVFVRHGKIVPVIDLHAIVNAGPCPVHLSSRIILVPHAPAGADTIIGLLATRVAEVREIALEEPVVDPDLPTPTLGRAWADSSGLMQIFDPDRFLATVLPGGWTDMLIAGTRP